MNVIERSNAFYSEQGRDEIGTAGDAAASAKMALEPEELDFDYLASQGLYTPDHVSEQLGLELRAVKRRLLRRLGFFRQGGAPAQRNRTGHNQNVLMVTSAAAGEGKTYTAANLALSLAFEDNIKTLLVDGDLVRPKVRDRLGLQEGPGVVDRLRAPSASIHQFCRPIKGAPLRVLTDGSMEFERQETLRNKEITSAFWQQLSVWDPESLIIVDAPPVLATPEAVLMSKHVDEILFVVAAGQTTKPAIAAALDEILEMNGNVSLILNRCLIGAGGSHYGSYEFYGEETV
ncbi:MAG: P-loop NTPase [Pseudomonadota bacterium]